MTWNLRADITGITDGQGLIYDDARNLFVPADLAGGVDVSDNGTPVVSPATLLNFGTGLSVTDDGGGQATVDATGSGGSVDVDDNGTPVAAASTLNFGTNLSVTDDGGGQVTIDGTGGGGSSDVPGWIRNLHTAAVAYAEGQEFRDADSLGTSVVPTGTLNLTKTQDLLSAEFFSQATSDIAAVMYPLSGTFPVGSRLETAVRIIGTSTANLMVGPVLSNGTADTSAVVFAMGITSGTQSLTPRGGTFTAVGSSLGGANTVWNPTPLLYLRIVRTGTTTWEMNGSPDGISWSAFGANTATITLTPTHYGIAVSAWGGGTPPRLAACEYLRIYEP